MKKIINLTPHAIFLNDGTVYPVSGELARVSNVFSEVDADGFVSVSYGEVYGLPESTPNTYYIVSGKVLAAAGDTRRDIVAPATGHPLTRRDEHGRIVSVPFLTRNKVD